MSSLLCVNFGSRSHHTLKWRLPSTLSFARYSSSRSSQQDKTQDGRARTRRWFLISSAAFGYALISYVSYHYTKISKLPEPPTGIADPVSQRGFATLDGPKTRDNPFSRIASTYDEEIDYSELLLRMKQKRRKLLLAASGDTLEVGAGTGRNIQCYPLSQLSSLTMCDKNERMLHEALVKYNNKRRAFELRNIEVYFSVQDCSSSNFKDNSFDTVVDTFGLCSFEDPVAVLQEMKRVVKPGGRILLLEHGRSRYGWLSYVLDKTAIDHAKVWGCWWNRDILDLVKQSGLDIKKVERYHFGTTYHIEAIVPLDNVSLEAG